MSEIVPLPMMHNEPTYVPSFPIGIEGGLDSSLMPGSDIFSQMTKRASSQQMTYAAQFMAMSEANRKELVREKLRMALESANRTKSNAAINEQMSKLNGRLTLINDLLQNMG